MRIVTDGDVERQHVAPFLESIQGHVEALLVGGLPDGVQRCRRPVDAAVGDFQAHALPGRVVTRGADREAGGHRDLGVGTIRIGSRRFLRREHAGG